MVLNTAQYIRNKHVPALCACGLRHINENEFPLVHISKSAGGCTVYLK